MEALRNSTDDTARNMLRHHGGQPLNFGLRFIFSSMQKYGCWCYLGDQHAYGGGNDPVDAYDKVCQNLHWAITCAKLEYENCEPIGSHYISEQFSVGGDIFYKCLDNDPCAVATCHIENQFAAKFIELTFNLEVGPPNMSQHSAIKGNFDNEAVCHLEPPVGHGPHELMCCGHYDSFTKRPIRVYPDEPKECCQAADDSFIVFNPDKKCCMDDGSVQSFGTCE